MKTLYRLLFLSLPLLATGQTNTAVESGNIGQCKVWGFPHTLLNTAAGTMNINAGVAVTVDQNRNIGTINLSGTGALDFSGANGITMSGSGPEITCRWDIPRSDSHTVVNNDGSTSPSYFQNWGTFFTAPYNGIYLWVRGSGFAATVTGGRRNGEVSIIQNNDYATSYDAFFQNESGSCPANGTVVPASWYTNIPFTLSAGGTLLYGGGTRYTGPGGCEVTTLQATLGNATILLYN